MPRGGAGFSFGAGVMSKIDTSTAAVEALMAGVTAGPWQIHDEKAYGHRSTHFFQEIWNNETDILVATEVTRAHNDGGAANMRFIRASRDLVPALLAERNALRADLMRAQEVVRVMQGASAHLRPAATGAATGAASGIHWATDEEKQAAVLRSRVQLAQWQEQNAPRPCKAREGVLRDVSGQAPAGTEYLDPGMGMAGDPGAGGE